MSSTFDRASPGVTGDPPWGEVALSPAELRGAPDVLVVGAGLLGLAVAAEATRSGLGHVQVIERGTVANGASGRNAGALLPDVHAHTNPPALTALQRRGLALHRARAAELGYPLERVDWIVRDAAAPGRPSDAAAVARATEGRVRLPGAVVVPDQAVTDPVAFATALCREVEVVTGVTVTEVTPGAPPTVRTSAGSLRPGRVVVAVGPDPYAPTPRYVTGHLALTPPLERPLWVGVSDDIVVVPRPDGRLLVGGTRDGERPEGWTDPEVVARIRTALEQLVPETAGGGFERVWTGQRPVVDDRLPLLDENGPGVVVAAGLYHSGVLTSPAIAECIAAFVRDGTWPALARPFHRTGRRLARR